MRAEELLVLNYRNFTPRLESLFQTLSKSPAALETFARDPSGVFGKEVFPEYNLSPGELNQANRVLFSLLSNPKFLDWSKQFEDKIKVQLKKIGKKGNSAEAIKHLTATMDRAQLYKEITEASLVYMDIELIYSRGVIDPDALVPFLPFPIGPDPLGCDLASVAVEIETFVYAVAAVAVFVVAVAAVAVIPAASVLEKVSREDLKRVSSFMATQLVARANQVRLSGSLTSFDAAKRGPVL